MRNEKCDKLSPISHLSLKKGVTYGTYNLHTSGFYDIYKRNNLSADDSDPFGNDRVLALSDRQRRGLREKDTILCLLK